MIKFSKMPYERLDAKKYIEDIKKLAEQMKNAKTADEAFEVHKRMYEISGEAQTLIVLSSIRYTIDTTDEFYVKEEEYYNEVTPEIETAMVSYQKELNESKFRKELEEKIGKVAFKNMELKAKSISEKIIPLMQEENELKLAYSSLIASARIDWEGESLNLSLIRPYLTDVNREVRAKAWEKCSSYFESIEDKLDDIYDKLVANRTKQARELGYENFVELGYARMQRNSYDKNDIARFRKQIKETYVPFALKIHEKRKNRLGLSNLSYIDEGVFYKDGNPKPNRSPEEILANGQKMYSELSKETKEFFDFMMEYELFDVLGRKTKKAGGYMTFLDKYNAPFIFANFNGTSGDVDVITHECGHAFQGYVASTLPIKEHMNIGMETAEIHSMSMEFFTEPWMDLFFSEEDKEKYLQMHVEEAAVFIPYGTMVDEFQHIIYENPELTKEERKSVWAKLEKEYRPYLDFTGSSYLERGGIWQRQLHIYEMPFYYIDYVIAQMLAFQYKNWLDKDFKEAFASYLKLCKLSASDFFVNMIKEVGLKSPFDEGVVAEIVKGLETKIK